MKRNLIKYTAAAVATAFLMLACTKKADTILSAAETSSFDNSSVAQVYIATVNAARNYVYVDGKPVTGALLGSGNVFPGTGYGFNVGAGNRAFIIQDTLRTSTQLPLSFGNNMQFGKHYTIFAYDTITSPKQKTVDDNIVIPADTSSRLRFANFTYTPTDPGGFDIFSLKKGVNIFTNINVTDVTGYIPYPSGITDTFYIRPTGTTANLQNRNPTTGAMVDIIGVLNPVAKRSYTLIFRGGFRATATNAPTVRTLSVFANY